ncbi:hypothetical protein D3C79_726970 [compost metagenome]
MPDFGLGAPSEIRGRNRAQLRRGRPAEPGADLARRRRRQVAGDGLREIGCAVIPSSSRPGSFFDSGRSLDIKGISFVGAVSLTKGIIYGVLAKAGGIYGLFLELGSIC